MVKRHIISGLAVIAALAGGYFLGQLHRESGEDGATSRGVPAASAQESAAEVGEDARGEPVHAGQDVPPRKFVQFSIGPANAKTILAERDQAWIGTSNGLIHYDPKTDRYIRYDNTSGLLSNGIFHVSRIDEEIWVGTYGGGLSVRSPSGQWRNYNIPSGMGDAFVYDVLKARNGDIWIATWSGANRVIDGAMDDIESWRLYTVENTEGGLPNDWVYGLSEGANGEIWLATEGGLARFTEEGQWAHWTHEQGVGAPYERVQADQPFKNDPGQFSSHHARQKVEQGLEDVQVAYNPNYVVSLEVDDEGNVWTGTWGAGLSRFDGRTWRTYTVADGLPGNHVFALGRDGQGRIWAGTSRGLARFDGKGFVALGKDDGLVSQVIFSIAFAEDGDLWVGGLGGVTWFPHGMTDRSGG